MIRRPPRSTQYTSSAASDVYKRQALTTQYISAIDEERYDANFKKHEERFNLSYDENDLDEMFKEAEKIMNEDEETKPV